MGNSPSIETLRETKQKVDDYLNNLKAQLIEETKKEAEDLANQVTEYYHHNQWNHSNFASGISSDFMQSNEFDLSNVNTIIGAISKAMFGDSKVPEGITIEKAADMGKAIMEAENLELFMVGKAFEVLSGIVESFGASSSISYCHDTKSEPLGNGFHLFVSVAAKSYEAVHFLKNAKIIQYLYIFQIGFSKGEAVQQAELSDIKRYEDAIQKFNEKLEHLDDEYSMENITKEQYDEQTGNFEALVDKFTEKIKELKGKEEG